MTAAFKLNVCLQFLRRTYYRPATQGWDVEKLKSLAADTYVAATETVTITGTSSELGSFTGQITFEKIILLGALEQLLIEVDPDNTPAPPPSGYTPDFSCRPIST